MNEARTGEWFQTFTGRQYYPDDPRVEDVCIEDIAHALSLLCRFAGHTKHFYSVGMHSVFVADLVRLHPDFGVYPNGPSLRKSALLHDAAEAYLLDVPKPLKLSERMQGYRDLEAINEKVISEVFRLKAPISHPIIKAADRYMLELERKHLLAVPPKPWREDSRANEFRMHSSFDLDDFDEDFAKVVAAKPIASPHTVKEAFLIEFATVACS